MSRPVVVVQSGDAYENRVRVLPVAIAARDQGWDPVVLVDDVGAASLFLAHGLAAVAVGALGEPDPVVEDVEPDPDELCPLLIAAREAGGRTIGDAEWRDIVVRSQKLWRMLDALGPSALFVWNGYTGVWANALRVYKQRRGLPGGFMERGPVADAVFVDANGVNGDASFARPSRETQAHEAAPVGDEPPAADRPRGLIGRLFDRLAPSEPPPLANGRARVVFVPLQVAEDSNILLHGGRIRRMRDLVGFGLALACALGRGWRVVARPHPEERAGLRLNLPEDPLLSIDGETPLDAYLERAAVCLTVNSNVGLSAALAGAVVVALGEGLYCRQPFVAARQDCDVAAAAADVRRRLGSGSPSEAARVFMGELERSSLFRLEGDPSAARERLERCGLDQRDVREEPSHVAGIRVERRGAAYREAQARLEALGASEDEIVVDFDFEPDETVFLTYRRNREPITRAGLLGRAEAALGRPARLSPTHRALGRGGPVLMTHSRRALTDLEGYEIVLDEFGLPHARTYVGT